MVRPNADPCTLSLPEGIINGQAIDLSTIADTFTINFTINDSDDPLTEEFTVTVKYDDKIVSFKTDSTDFSLKIMPSKKLKDTLVVTVTDKTTGSTPSTVTIPITYQIKSLSQITDLLIWNNAGNFTTKMNNNISWNPNENFSASFSSDNPNSAPTIVPAGLNGFNTLQFSGLHFLYNNQDTKFSIDSAFTIFAVVHYTENSQEHQNYFINFQ